MKYPCSGIVQSVRAIRDGTGGKASSCLDEGRGSPNERGVIRRNGSVHVAPGDVWTVRISESENSQLSYCPLKLILIPNIGKQKEDLRENDLEPNMQLFND